MKRICLGAVIVFVFGFFQKVRISSCLINSSLKSDEKGLHQLNIDELLSMWSMVWKNPELLDKSPSGPPLRRMIEAIHIKQNPKDCSRSRFLVYSLSRKAGFGSLVKSYIIGFHLALKYNRTFLVDPFESFFWTRGCKNADLDGNLECFFRPLSEKCSAKEIFRLSSLGKLQMKVTTKRHFINRDGYMNLASDANVILFRGREGLIYFPNDTDFNAIVLDLVSDISTEELFALSGKGIDSRRLYITALTYFFLRLNDHMATYVFDSLSKILGSELNFRSMIGVPIRVSDKCNREMKCEDTANIVDVAHRIAFSFPEISSIIITSESSNASSLEAIGNAQNKSNRPPLRVIRNNMDIYPETGRACLKCWNNTPAAMLQSSMVTLHLQSLP